MKNWSKIFRGLVVLAVTAGLGILIGWLVSRQGDVAPMVVAPPPAASQPLAAVQPAAQTPESASPPASVEHKPVKMKITILPDPVAIDWDKKLDDILLGDDDENGKADKILALIPTAPADAQHELAQHLVNMLQDDHYDGAAQMLTNATTSADVSDVLMNDLLNRNNTLKLPLLLAIARNNDHPLKDQALDLLGLLTQEDNGTNWDQWSSTIDTWLQNNPQ